MFLSDFSENNLKEYDIMILTKLILHTYPIPNSMSGKILGLELTSKMLSTNQIVKDS